MDAQEKNNENEMAQKRKLMDKYSVVLRKQQKSAFLRLLPAELLNEIFSALPFKNAFTILAKIPNGLLAKNVCRIFKNMKMAIKANKWNELDCGSMIAISEDGLSLNYINSANRAEKKCVRAILPIPKLSLTAQSPYIVYYFEVELIKKSSILNKIENFSVGFCDKQFPLETQWQLGCQKNSIGIWNKDDIVIHIRHPFLRLCRFIHNGFFQNGDIAGIGLLHDPAEKSIQCFSTCNGLELVSEYFSSEFFDMIELFPAITMNCASNSFRANFCAIHQWHYDPFKLVLQKMSINNKL